MRFSFLKSTSVPASEVKERIAINIFPKRLQRISITDVNYPAVFWQPNVETALW